MELDRLHEFVLIAKHQSIKKAAEELHLSPATLSSRLHTLEDALGIFLFQRKKGALKRTEEGNRFYADALEIVSEYKDIRRSLEQSGNQTFRSIRIAVTGIALPLFLGPFLDLLNAKYPYFQLELMDDTHYSIEEGLTSGNVDVYFAPVLNNISHSKEIIKKTISPSRQYVLLPENHPLASQQTISMRDLNNECFILYPKTQETSIRDFQLANLQAADIRYSVYDSNSSPVFFTLLIPIGKGLILLPMPIINLPPKTVCLPLTDVPYAASSSLFYNRGTDKPEVKEFIDLFFQFTKEAALYEHRQAL